MDRPNIAKTGYRENISIFFGELLLMSYKYPLATSSWDEQEFEAIQDVVASGKFTMGEKVEQFEQDFALYFGSTYAVMVNSGSSANLLMIAALRHIEDPRLKLNPGDTIIVPAVSWSTTYYPLYQYNLKLKFVDINPYTLNYDLEALSEAITSQTRAIMVVNLLGNPNDFHELQRLTSDRDILIMEDNCESMGAKYDGAFTGTFGIMGSFSCYYSHHISTMEGGVILTDSEELYHILISLRSHGWTRNLPSKTLLQGREQSDPFTKSFDFILPGYNLRPLEMSGALGIEQLRKLPGLIKERRANAALFQSMMADHPKFIIQQEIGKSSWFGFSLVLRKPFQDQRKSIVRELESLGFECRPIVAGNFVKNKVVNYFSFEIHGDLKNADYIDANGLFIGNHHYPILETIEKLAAF
jgi:CDP-6-deoxy-D-xylo-4-hexulose-3-dehydrase